MLISLVITAFHRDHLLKLTLPTITSQRLNHKLEVIIVNDGVPGVTEEIARQHGVKYIFTGQRNLESIKWRVPGYALNIAAKYASGDVLIISCAEMFHIGDLLNQISAPVIANPYALGIPHGKDDDGHYLRHIQMIPQHSQEIYDHLPKLKTQLPFLFALRRKLYLEIGGYDEDLIGQAFDDDDFVGRLLDYGCSYSLTEAQCVHLYHSRGTMAGRNKDLHAYNKKIYEARKGIIVRNVGKEWGSERRQP